MALDKQPTVFHAQMKRHEWPGTLVSVLGKVITSAASNEQED